MDSPNGLQQAQRDLIIVQAQLRAVSVLLAGVAYALSDHAAASPPATTDAPHKANAD